MDAGRKSPTIVIAAGGTGGHLFPAQSLAQELQRRGWRIVLITDKRGERFAQNFPCDERHAVSAATMAGRGPLGRVAAMGSIVAGVAGARSLLKDIRPDFVAGFGGYPSFPALTAAWLLGLSRGVHEQNAVLGRVNRFLAPRVDAVATAFPGTARVPQGAAGKIVVVGNPIRDAAADRAGAAYVKFNGGDPIRLVVFGGSQGARIFAQIAPKAIAALPDALRERLRITHQVREEDIAEAAGAYKAAGLSVVDPESLKTMPADLFRSYDKGAYVPDVEIFPFFSDLPDRIAAAHLVVARAGASTVSELAAIGRPALLTPLAIAMDDHQTANAQALETAGGAEILAERDLTPETLAAQFERLLSDSNALAAMAAGARKAAHPAAAKKLADLVEQIAAGREAPATVEAV